MSHERGDQREHGRVKRRDETALRSRDFQAWPEAEGAEQFEWHEGRGSRIQLK